MTNNICTFNVKGLNNKLKRSQVFTYLKQQQFSVCLLQETHLPSNNKHIYEDEWGEIHFLVVLAQTVLAFAS